MFAPLRLPEMVGFLSLCFLAGTVPNAGADCGCEQGAALGSLGGCSATVSDCGQYEGDAASCGCQAADVGGHVAHAAGCLASRLGAGSCRRRGCRLCACGAKWSGDGSYCGLPPAHYPVPFATPRPTTPTHFMYPPLMPHNSLPNYRSTYAFRHGPGMSQTQVHWRSPKLLNLADYIHNIFEIPR